MVQFYVHEYSRYKTGIIHEYSSIYSRIFMNYVYTPGIYAEGYIVFVFPFVRTFILCSFIRTSFRHVSGI